MTYEELMEETGAELGIEGFAPDADGVCVLVSDIGEIVIMDCKEQKEMVLLNAVVTDVPPNAGASLLAALEANRGFKDTNGATLSVDPETHRFELSRYAFLEYLDPDKFIEMVEKFAATLVSVREKLESAGDKLAESELPDFGEFIRV